VTVSVGGGSEPVWSPDGATLFYRGPTHLMSAAVIEHPTLAVAHRDSLFIDTYERDPGYTNYDVFPSSREFLMEKPSGQQGNLNLYVLVNWAQLLGKQSDARDGR
jgi:hypothetical protein